jgi:hypothetical protein
MISKKKIKNKLLIVPPSPAPDDNEKEETV